MFSFSTQQQDLSKNNADDFVAMIPSGISDVVVLFSELVKRLLLPEYFGNNWNALSDCLRDFHWLEKRKIIIIHDELPILPEADLFQYLDVLREAVEDWRGDDQHSLEVVFPEGSKTKIERILSMKF